jgi:hypothetical protein
MGSYDEMYQSLTTNARSIARAERTLAGAHRHVGGDAHVIEEHRNGANAAFDQAAGAIHQIADDVDEFEVAVQQQAGVEDTQHFVMRADQRVQRTDHHAAVFQRAVAGPRLRRVLQRQAHAVGEALLLQFAGREDLDARRGLAMPCLIQRRRVSIARDDGGARLSIDDLARRVDQVQVGVVVLFLQQRQLLFDGLLVVLVERGTKEVGFGGAGERFEIVLLDAFEYVVRHRQVGVDLDEQLVVAIAGAPVHGQAERHRHDQ